MIGFFRRLIQRYGFFRKPYVSPFVDAGGWERHDFFTEHQRKAEKLASLARYMDSIKALREKAIRQKKCRSHFDAALQSAMTERLEIEGGARTFNGTAWTRRE